MLISTETLKQDLDQLDRDQLQQVADFIAFLKFRGQHRRRVVLNPTQGSEQTGVRPVIVFQNNIVSQFSTTIIAIPLTTNQRRAALPICLTIEQGNGGLSQDSVAL